MCLCATAVMYGAWRPFCRQDGCAEAWEVHGRLGVRKWFTRGFWRLGISFQTSRPISCGLRIWRTHLSQVESLHDGVRGFASWLHLVAYLHFLRMILTWLSNSLWGFLAFLGGFSHKYSNKRGIDIPLATLEYAFYVGTYFFSCYGCCQCQVLIVMWAFFVVVSLLSKLPSGCDKCHKLPSVVPNHQAWSHWLTVSNVSREPLGLIGRSLLLVMWLDIIVIVLRHSQSHYCIIEVIYSRLSHVGMIH
jgi:hypothetical protein